MATNPSLDPEDQSRNPVARAAKRLFNRGSDQDFSDLSGDSSGIRDYSDLSESSQQLREDIASSERNRMGLYNRNRRESSERDGVNNAAESAKQGPIALAGAKARSFVAKKKSKSKLALLGLVSSGLGFIGILGIMMLFMVVAGFSVKQQAEVLKLANFARLHVAPMRRTSQLFVEKSINPDADGYKINTQGRKFHERFARYNPDTVLSNLRQEEKLVFVTKTGEKRTLKSFGKKVPYDTLDYIRIGNDGGAGIPVKNWFSPVSNYREQKAFVNGIQDAVDGSDLFAGKSQYFRTRTADAIMEASDVKLYRFIKGSRKIKTFKDAVVSAYERIKGGRKPSVKVGLPEAQEAADGYEAKWKENLDVYGSAGDASGDATYDLTKKAVSNNGRNFARGLSLGVLTATVYCSADAYINGQAEAAQARLDGDKRSALLSLSASDQIEKGHMSSTEVMMEAKRINGFDKSRAYQEDVGNPLASNMPRELGVENAPVPDSSSTLYQLFNGIKTVGDNIAAPGFPLSLKDLPDGAVTQMCSGLLSTPGAITAAVLENVVAAVLAVPSGGTSAVAQTAAKGGIRQAAVSAVQKIATREVLTRAAKGTAQDAFMFLLVDALIKQVLPAAGNSATDDTDVAYAKMKAGSKTYANDLAYAGGGRDLSKTEVAQVDKMVNDKRIARLHKMPLLERIAYTGDPTTPASQMIASLPFTANSLKQETSQLAFTSLNPFSVLSDKTARIASSVSGGDKVLAADGDEQDYYEQTLSIPTVGWSVDELEKMLEPAYWPLDNAKYVESNPDEFTELKECFSPMTNSPKLPDNCKGDTMKTESAFRYRLYQLDGGNASDSAGSDYNDGALGALLNLQEITEDGASAEGTGEITGDPRAADSSATPCAPGTKDLGPRDDAYTQGKQIKIRVCGLPNIPSSGQESTPSSPFYVDGADGMSLVSSVVSDAWYSLGQAALADNIRLSSISTWRTMAHQTDLCNRNKACKGGNYAIVGKPGRSNHQAATALDLTGVSGKKAGASCAGRATSPTPQYQWMKNNAAKFGIKQYAAEAWHWGPLETC